jgi:hypothetical protein
MSVLVRFGSRKAILRSGRWISSDVALEEQLNRETTEWIQHTGGPGFRDPNQERTVASEMAARLDGRILLEVKPRSREADLYFFAQRQLTLSFDSALSLDNRTRRRTRTRTKAAVTPAAAP